MRVLLDTHVWLWRLLEPERVPSALESCLAEPSNELYLSSVSVWEALVLARKGRLRLRSDAQEWVREALRRSDTIMAPVDHGVAMRSEDLAGFESDDPADRLLVATALEKDLTMATADRRMLAYGSLATVT